MEMIGLVMMALGKEGVDLVWSIVDKIYETWEAPEDVMNSVFIEYRKFQKLSIEATIAHLV